VLLNAAPVRWEYGELLGLADILIANHVEAAALAGGAAPEAAARALRAAGAGGVIVTRGEEGCLLAEGTGVTALPAPPATKIDTSGAGDVFCGVLAALLARDWPETLAAMVATAQRAAALSVARPGCFASFPSREELQPLLGAA
jgi:ribokinase